MTCTKKFLYSVAFVFLFSVFTVFGISPNTNAASAVCTATYSSSGISFSSGSDNCSGNFKSVKFSSNSCVLGDGFYPNSTITFNFRFTAPYRSTNLYLPYNFAFSSPVYYSLDYSDYSVFYDSTNSSNGFNSHPDCSVSLEFYNESISDLFAGGITPEGSLEITENGTYDVSNYAEAVVDVPIIYGDYHDDLISINNSIIICAGVALVIYFFYAIYRMMFKGVKS